MNISLKGNKYGLTVKIAETAAMTDIIEEIPKVFSGTEAMFGDDKVAIAFEGKALTEKEKEELLTVISDSCKLNILCMLDLNSDTEVRFKKAVANCKEEIAEVDKETSAQNDALGSSIEEMKAEVQAAIDLRDNEHEKIDKNISVDSIPEVKADTQTVSSSADPFDFVFPSAQKEPEPVAEEEVDWSKVCKFYKGNVRSGIILEEETSLVIIGDINPGGEVISNGNIIVLGSLKGTAHAGASGNDGCFVYANDMRPMQIRIGSIIARGDDRFKKEKEGSEPRIAVATGNSIAIQPCSKEVFDFIEI